MKRQTKHLYAVVRVNEDLDATEPWNFRIGIKEVVLTIEEAQQEVERLNRLNSKKGCVYFWQTTRLVER